MTQTGLFASTIDIRLIGTHIPLLVIWDVSGVRPNSADYRNEQVYREECKQSKVDYRLFTRGNYLVWICLPHSVEGNLGVVAGQCGKQEELRYISNELIQGKAANTYIYIVHK